MKTHRFLLGFPLRFLLRFPLRLLLRFLLRRASACVSGVHCGSVVAPLPLCGV
jgi:hypothetical protein